jgi:hypothetical protein
MNRRTLLHTVALVIPASALAACSTASPLTPAEIVADVGVAVTGLQNVIKGVEAAAPSLIPTATAATINTALTDAQQVASSLVASTPALTGASIVQTVEGYLNAVLTILAGPPINGLIPAPFNMAVTAVSILLPTFEAFANQYLHTTAAASIATLAARRKFAALAPTMTPAQAAAILASYK